MFRSLSIWYITMVFLRKCLQFMFCSHHMFGIVICKAIFEYIQLSNFQRENVMSDVD